MLSAKSKRAQLAFGVSALALLALGSAAAGHDDHDGAFHGPATRTPIKHVITIMPENRSFDHVYGLYKPRHGQTISNLLTKGILNADGTPGPNFSKSAQFQVGPQGSYFISASSHDKLPYVTLPTPQLAGTPKDAFSGLPPFSSLIFPDAVLQLIEPVLSAQNIGLLRTGASGLPSTTGIDTRVTDAAMLASGPYQLTGPTMPYDSYTGDTTHRFFQMWQQSDCSLSHASKDNPSGCLNDLYPFAVTTDSPNSDSGGNSMAMLNVNNGDAPLFKKLADEYTIGDNFHQPHMGGTMHGHAMLMTGDSYFFTDANGKPAVPPASVIANPNPRPGTTNNYTVDGNWMNCSDKSQPGIAPIANYLASLELKTNCEPNAYYTINNTGPGFHLDGSLVTSGQFVPPQTRRTIGDALNDKGISWAYYGGALKARARLEQNPTSQDIRDQIGVAYCDICNAFQYSKSIMTDPAQRAAHLKDLTDLISDIDNGTLPAVSFAKPDGIMDGHPQSSKLDLFEGQLQFILDHLHANPKLEAETAIFIVFDEGGGLYDSGYIQPLDFFGDGPRIPFVVISPYSRGGKVVHTYYDHVSVLKFIERNWGLKPLTKRSRDNLPNPETRHGNEYVPVNSPAIGDLFEMFDFGRDADDDHDRDDDHGHYGRS